MTRFKPSNGYQTALIQWLDAPSLNVFATITLKQALPLGREGVRWQPITMGDVQRTAWIIRDRVSRKVFGRRFKYQPFLTFHHGGGETDKRHHLHFVAYRPAAQSLGEYAEIFNKVGKHLIWVYEREDFRPIEPGTERTVIQ